MKNIFSAAAVALLTLSASATPAREASRVDPAAIALYQQANTQLLARMRAGVRAAVQLERPDGTRVDGYDEYAIDDGARLREVRGDRESIVVGGVLCVHEGGGDAECDDTDEIDLGLRPLVPDDVFHATLADAPCGNSTCRQVDVLQHAHSLSIEQLLNPSGPASSETSHYTFRLLVRDDGLPYSFNEARLDGERLIEARAHFRFDYSSTVAPITHGSK